eukprot:CCRYP_003826-RA/>CCRYP_003826-RA protein AED:0.38 eAED:0.38 QI:0/0/0/1/1/1/2/0/73
MLESQSSSIAMDVLSSPNKLSLLPLSMTSTSATQLLDVMSANLTSITGQLLLPSTPSIQERSTERQLYILSIT